MLSPEFYMIHHKGIITDEPGLKPFFGLSVGTAVCDKKEHYDDEIYKKITSYKNYITLNLVNFLGFRFSYQRLVYNSKIISFYSALGINVSFMSYIAPERVPFAGVGIKLNPYKRFYITYSLNKDLGSGTWATFRVGVHVAHNIGIAYKNILPIDGFTKSASYEYYYGIDKAFPVFNLDILF